MVSYLDLLLIFMTSLAFVLLFRLQRNFFPTNYFANSQIILDTVVTYRMILVRYIFIFIFGLISYFITKNTPVILIGTFLGAFLIVWPTILAPSEAYVDVIKPRDRIFIYAMHTIFIITSIIVVYFSTMLLPLMIANFNENLTSILIELVKWLVFSGLGISGEKSLSDLLDKRVRKNNEELIDNDE